METKETVVAPSGEEQGGSAATAVAETTSSVVSTDGGPEGSPAGHEGSPPASASTEGEPSQPAAAGTAGAQVEGSAPPANAGTPPDAALAAPESKEPVKVPFDFTVDRTKIEIPGAYVDESGEIRGLTVDGFRQGVLPRIGDRTVWHQREQTYKRTIEDLKRENTALADDNRPEIVRANKAFERLVEILEMDDVVARDAELEKLHASLPALAHEAETTALTAERDLYKGKVKEDEQRAVIRETIPVLQTSLREYVETALQHESIKDAGLSLEKMEKALWDTFGIRGLFAIGVEDDAAHFETPAGPAAFAVERIDNFLLHQAGLVTEVKSEAQKRVQEAEERARRASEAAEVARRNAAALKDDTSAPPVVPVSGSPAAGEVTQPWRDPSKTFEERKKLFEQHLASQGLASMI